MIQKLNINQEQRSITAPAAGELQISVRYTGICGSDQHYYNHFRNGDIQVREPMALGHESSGAVEVVGDDVSGFKPGDRVALEVGIPCETCRLCKAGRYNICPKMSFRSSAKSFPHFQGTLQERINHPAKWCHKIPDSVTMEEGALLEPLSVAIHAVRRAKLDKGANVLILGAGAVGLLTAAMLRTAEVGSIAIADVAGSRVEFAKEHGFADVGVEVPRANPESLSTLEGRLSNAKETAVVLMKAANGAEDAQFDAVFECTGVESCAQISIYSTIAGGKVMLIGMGTPIQTLPISAAALREVDLVGVFRYAATYEYGLEVLANKAQYKLPDISKLATHRFRGFQGVTDAFNMAGKPADEEGKLVIKVLIET